MCCSQTFVEDIRIECNSEWIRPEWRINAYHIDPGGIWKPWGCGI